MIAGHLGRYVVNNYYETQNLNDMLSWRVSKSFRDWNASQRTQSHEEKGKSNTKDKEGEKCDDKNRVKTN